MFGWFFYRDDINRYFLQKRKKISLYDSDCSTLFEVPLWLMMINIIVVVAVFAVIFKFKDEIKSFFLSLG